ncbi:hypothetical protein [Nocardia terrae]|uniref:hypothetical protein n=1 Tax=Nocardia terrae TaxID=2675851 RepID=UPI0018DFBDC5|nr:hypothetical protein [Nocardia terrae]
MLDITSRRMTSDISPEYAIRETRYGEVVWRLSWLPSQPLTHEQAHAGMELDEILSDPAVVYDEAAHLWAADLATRLGIGVDRAVILLAQRLAERMYQPDPDEPTEPADLPDWIAALPSGAMTGARSRHLWR